MADAKAAITHVPLQADAVCQLSLCSTSPVTHANRRTQRPILTTDCLPQLRRALSDVDEAAEAQGSSSPPVATATTSAAQRHTTSPPHLASLVPRKSIQELNLSQTRRFGWLWKYVRRVPFNYSLKPITYLT